MVLVTWNKQQRLLYLTYVQKVDPTQLAAARSDLVAALAELPPGVRLLADMSQLEFMDPECASEMGISMDLLAKHGVDLIVRVIPDATKDIGLNILTVFHYPKQPRIVNCEKMADGLRQLFLAS
jgi:hypothetical protein